MILSHGSPVFEAASSATLPRSRNGGRLLVDGLRANGVDRIFCVPGESYLEVLDALYDTPEIELVVCRHEGAAANMAEADGKLTGRPGICFVTRALGATHASAGVFTAFHDSTPMILFVGQVRKSFRQRGAFQELDLPAMFGGFTKWAAEIDQAERIPEFLSRAFNFALSGRPGPVVLSLPEDILAELSGASDAGPSQVAQSYPSAVDIEAVRAALATAQRPLLFLGGSGWTLEAGKDIRTFAEHYKLPVVSSFRRQDIFDNRHPNYAGHLTLGTSSALVKRVQDADLIIALGTRLGDVPTSGYTLLQAPRPKQRLIHIHPDPAEIGRIFHADVAICAAMPTAARALKDTMPVVASVWLSWLQEARDQFVSASTPRPAKPDAGFVDLAQVIAHLNTELSDADIIANGAGNYTVWLHRYFHYRQLGNELAPTSGSMGYGLPAAIAAKLRRPESTVVCLAGDGCFLMYPQELATAMQNHAAIIVIVVDNGMYGTIRMHQERRFPGRVSGTSIVNPNFVSLAKSFGAYAEAVTSTEDFASAFARARGAGKPALLALTVDPNQITPDWTLRGE